MAPVHGKVTQERWVNRSPALRVSALLMLITLDGPWRCERAVLWVQVQGCIPDSGSRPSEGQAERYFQVLTKAVGMRE